jgi:hypothetical protein
MAGTLYRVGRREKNSANGKVSERLNAEAQEHNMARVKLHTLRQIIQGRKEARFARVFMSDLEGPTR